MPTLKCVHTSLSATSAVIIMYVTKAQFSTIDVLVAMLMSRWEFRIVPSLTIAGGNASATYHKMLVLTICNDLRL